MIDLALLLEAEGLDPEQILVLRHCPSEPGLNKVIGWLAEEEPDTFNMYQRSHGPRTEAAVSRAGYLASFIGHEAGRAVFVGLYSVEGHEDVTRTDCNVMPLYRRLIDLGMSEWDETSPVQTALLFDLKLTEVLRPWKGRLVVQWPPPDRSWYRWGGRGRNLFPVHSIHEDNLLSAAMPAWDRLVLSWRELKVLPARWRAELALWRGIYHVFDASDGKAYVGSAAGTDNILGRWLSYASSGHGGNALLRARNPGHLYFSVLQRLSPDMPANDVVAIESSWKQRLHTRQPHGLNAN
jgi:hypothetical protein